MSNGPAHGPATALPVAAASPARQAIVVIHGMGEQMPMDTIKGFVRAAWETTDGLAAPRPRAKEIWSRPDVRTGSLELRRITTRQSIHTATFTAGVRSDFYELYWADLSGGSTWNQVKDWIGGLLLRNPFTRVPRDVLLAWLVLWVITLTVILLTIAASLKDPTTIFGVNVWDYFPLNCLRSWPAGLLAAVVAVLGWIGTSFIVPYFGRVVRYTRAKPDNIAARKNIRERGLALLNELHNGGYDRIIIVGHSLGSILAYDLISYFWARHDGARLVIEGSPEFKALLKIEKVLADPGWPNEKLLEEYRAAQSEFGRLLRQRPKPAANATDTRWLITDFVTLGSPLTHAEFLMANSERDLAKRQKDREYPTSPPLRELLDEKYRVQAEAAGFVLDKDEPKLLAFPPKAKEWRLHHAAPYAAVRWTNIYDPAAWVAFGDLISGPVAPLFGPAIVDVNLKKARGQSFSFTHTKYWSLPEPEETETVPAPAKPAGAPAHIVELRKALDLAGQLRVL